MRVKIDIDELWPIYLIDPDIGREVDLPADKVDWVKKVFAELDEVQKYLQTARESEEQLNT